MSALDPTVPRSMTFIFPRCQARLEGADLVVSVPLPHVTCAAAAGPALQWSAPGEIAADLVIDCAPGPRLRADAAEYPAAPVYAQARAFRFRGGFWYGRAPFDGAWALFVQGAVRSLAGLPQGDALLITSFGLHTARAEGPLNGPHLPYP